MLENARDGCYSPRVPDGFRLPSRARKVSPLAMKRIRFEANGLTFHALAEGEGPLALCLHGFPDTPHTFRALAPALAAAGYRVVAPWMRGFAPTGVPADGRYQLAALAQDVAGMIDALSKGDQAVVIGHDWGAAASYGGAVLAGERIRRLVALSVPHPFTFMNAMMSSYAQQKRSWYMFFFQTPLAEAVVPADDFAFIERLWRDWSPGFEPPADLLAEARAALSAPGSLEAALGYYRTLFNPAFLDPGLTDLQDRITATPVGVPSLYLHGAKDGCVGAELIPGMEAFFAAGLETEIFPGAGHFVHLEAPEAVAERILGFLKT